MNLAVCYIDVVKTVTLTYKINIRADQQTVFKYVSDWEQQSEWILFTKVKQLSGSVDPKDANLVATTKIGPIKFIDTMLIAEWLPFKRIVVEHTGRIILGKGIFTIRKISKDSCEFTWQEVTPVPFGYVGKAVLVVIKPFLRLLFGSSLKRLKIILESI